MFSFLSPADLIHFSVMKPLRRDGVMTADYMYQGSEYNPDEW